MVDSEPILENIGHDLDDIEVVGEKRYSTNVWSLIPSDCSITVTLKRNVGTFKKFIFKLPRKKKKSLQGKRKDRNKVQKKITRGLPITYKELVRARLVKGE